MNSLVWISKSGFWNPQAKFCSGLLDRDNIAFNHSDQEKTHHSLFYTLRSELLFVSSALRNFDNTRGNINPLRFRCLHQHRAWNIPRRKPTVYLFPRDLQCYVCDSGHPGDKRKNAHFSYDKMRVPWHQSSERVGDYRCSLPLLRRSEKRIYCCVQRPSTPLLCFKIFFSWRSPCIVLGKLNPVQACGPDAIPNWLLKEYAYIVSRISYNYNVEPLR